MNHLSLDTKIDLLLTNDEVAALFKVTPRTFRRDKKAGKAPVSIMVNGKELFPTSHINQYILEQNPHIMKNNDVRVSAAALQATPKGTSE